MIGSEFQWLETPDALTSMTGAPPVQAGKDEGNMTYEVALHTSH